jgi:hypothetical protein
VINLQKDTQALNQMVNDLIYSAIAEIQTQARNIKKDTQYTKGRVEFAINTLNTMGGQVTSVKRNTSVIVKQNEGLKQDFHVFDAHINEQVEEDRKTRYELFFRLVEEQRLVKSGIETYLEDIFTYQGMYHTQI